MEEKRQEELRLQYLKEQEAYKAKQLTYVHVLGIGYISLNRELIGQANPMGFMYEPPPSFAKGQLLITCTFKYVNHNIR